MNKTISNAEKREVLIMKETAPYVITISRMLGSGGLIIGKQLAEHLNIPCFDKEILFRAAEEFGLKSADLETHEEKPASVWDLFLKSGILENPDLYIEPALSLPTDRQLYETESEIIRNIA
jgi:cytidylate kinase